MFKSLKKLSQRPGLALMFLTCITLLSGKPEYHEGTNDLDKTFRQLRAQKELSTMMLFKRTLVILHVLLYSQQAAAPHWPRTGENPLCRIKRFKRLRHPKLNRCR